MPTSTVFAGNLVAFPPFMPEKIYMDPFESLDELEEKHPIWKEPVRQMLDNIDYKRAFLMVDAAVVPAGQLHRRGGIHVDLNWQEAPHAHGGSPLPPGHGVPVPNPPRHVAPNMWSGPTWKPAGPDWSSDNSSQALILASTTGPYSVPGAEAYVGEWNGEPDEGGDCSHIDVSNLDRLYLRPGRAYLLDSCWTLHRSVPMPEVEMRRTVIRLNVELANNAS